jgi:hypothetical protein
MTNVIQLFGVIMRDDWRKPDNPAEEDANVLQFAHIVQRYTHLVLLQWWDAFYADKFFASYCDALKVRPGKGLHPFFADNRAMPQKDVIVFARY